MKTENTKLTQTIYIKTFPCAHRRLKRPAAHEHFVFHQKLGYIAHKVMRKCVLSNLQNYSDTVLSWAK